MGRQQSASEKRATKLRIVACAIAALVTALAGHTMQSLMGSDPSPAVSGGAAAAVAIAVWLVVTPRRG
jgi:hypothetical protein